MPTERRDDVTDAINAALEAALGAVDGDLIGCSVYGVLYDEGVLYVGLDGMWSADNLQKVVDVLRSKQENRDG